MRLACQERLLKRAGKMFDGELEGGVSSTSDLTDDVWCQVPVVGWDLPMDAGESVI